MFARVVPLLLLAAFAAYGRAPNVLFIALDDLNDWVGVLGGHSQTKTPNIDRLAARGMLFANAHTASPSCNPSRTALLTGLPPSSSGVYDNPHDWRRAPRLRGLPTLPEHLRAAGYRTRGGGKIFHAHTYYEQGFYGLNKPSAWHEFFPSKERQLPFEIRPRGWPANGNPGLIFSLFDWSPVEVSDDGMGDGMVVQWAERQLRDAGDDPLFLAVGIYRPHLPWYVPPRYFDLHPLEKVELPPFREDDLEDVPERARGGISVRPHQWVLEDPIRWRQGVQGYLASISFADAMVGRLIDALDRSGRADETIVVLWSDHGFHLGTKGRWRKFTLWEESTHVPLIVVAPGVTTAGARTDAPVSLMDVYPTVADLTGVGSPGHVEGRSLRRLIENPRAEWPHAAVTTWGFGTHAVRDRRWRYIRYETGEEELYDHDSDPEEWENRADDPSLSVIKERLRRFLPQVNAPPAE